jgi:dienelactone hydrolase
MPPAGSPRRAGPGGDARPAPRPAHEAGSAAIASVEPGGGPSGASQRRAPPCRCRRGPWRWLRRAALAFVSSAGLAAPSLAQEGWHLRDPWPAPAEVAGIAGVDVAFPSSSPFVPADAARAEPTTALGRLYMPRSDEARPAPPRSIPAVVMLHGAGGIRYARELTYARQLAAMGAAAVVLDVFAARRDRALGFTERLIEITETMALADAYAALRHLPRRHPEIDPDRVVLVGFSYGAMAAMYGVWATVAERLAPEGERFAGHVAFYGPCLARFEEARTTGAPVLMLYGTGDELIDPDRCAAFAEDLRRGGSAATVIAYREALHQWDGGTPPLRTGRLLGACRLSVGADGRVRDLRTGLPMAGPFLRRLILAACVEDRPYMMGADEAVRARSNRDFGRFLDMVFRPRQG